MSEEEKNQRAEEEERKKKRRASSFEVERLSSLSMLSLAREKEKRKKREGVSVRRCVRISIPMMRVRIFIVALVALATIGCLVPGERRLASERERGN